MPEAKPRYGGILKVVPQGGIKFLDPHATGAIVTGYVGRNVYEQMFTLNSKYEIRPQLVDTWQTSADGKTWTFKLRAGLKFHNGDPLRVEDVIASVVREASLNPMTRGFFRDFTAVPDNFTAAFQKVDDLTFKLQLTKPSSYLLVVMAQPDPYMASVMPPSIYSIKVGEPVKEAIGTGPWKFVEWVPGSRLVLERWADYKSRPEPSDFLAGGHTVYLDRLEVVEIPDHASRVSALKTGEVQYLDDFNLALGKTLAGTAGITVLKVQDGHMGVFSFNHAAPPFNNKLARQAVAYGAGVERVMTTTVGDPSWWKECPFFLHCGTVWSENAMGAGKQIQTLKGNLPKARELVKQAGVEGARVRIFAAQDMVWMPDGALVMREILEDIGFKAEVVAVDWATQVARGPTGEGFEASMSFTNFANGVDPLGYDGVVKSPFVSGWPDPGDKATAVRRKFMEATDFKQQIEAVRQLDEIHWDELPILKVGMFFPPRAYRNEVKGIKNYLFPLFFDVWLER